jgi:hypothetical protein
MESAMEINESNQIKNAAATYGYKWQMSMYGVLTDVETGVSEYRRIEVLSNAMYQGVDIEFIYRFFNALKPASTYTIWLYNKKTESITLVRGYN